MIQRTIEYLLKLFYPFFKKFLPYQVYAYLSTGAANTILNIVLFALLYQWVLPAEIMLAGFSVASYTISLLIAFVVTVPSGYWLASHFAFKDGSSNGDAQQLMKYSLVVLQGLASDYILLKLLIIFFHLQPTVAKIISTMAVLTCNYLLQKYFTFRVNKAV